MTVSLLKFVGPVLLSLMSTTLSEAQDLAITSALVYASPQAPARTNMTVLLRDGNIKALGEHLAVPKDVDIIDCRDCIVMAGFWNAHVHFMEQKWNDAARAPAATLSKQLRDMLTRSGFTTVVDTGSDTENTVALRQRVLSGEIAGPRILTAGIPIFPVNALPYYLADLPAGFKAKLAQPDSPNAASKFVEKNRAAGADIVKLFTGSIVGPDHIVPMQIDIARAAVEEAHRHSQLVFSHSTNLDGTQVAIAAGVDVLAHAPESTSGIDEAMLQRMAAQHITIIPTLMLFSRDDNIGKIRQLLLRYHRLGGRLVYGTDTGFLQDYDQDEEFRQLFAAGFGFRDVLAMLTSEPAALFGLSKSEGKVAPGMHANLTVLSADPAIVGSSAFVTIKMTIRNGKVIWRKE